MSLVDGAPFGPRDASVEEAPDERSASPLALLRTPSGLPLTRAADALVAPDGTRFALEDGVVRMLDAVDPLLAAELRAQEAALEIYADDHSLMTLCERSVSRFVVEELLQPVPGAVLLDAGCGIGLLGKLYPELGLCGVDASLPLLKAAGDGYRLRVECSAERLPFPDAAFDAVLAVNMLHHVIEPSRAVREYARVLKAGGLLVAIDPRRLAPIEWAKWLLRRGSRAYAPTHRAFGVSEYAGLLRADGALEVEELRRVGLLGLIVAGGCDAIGLSRYLPAPRRLWALLERLDAALASLPGATAAGLNLAVRARRRA